MKQITALYAMDGVEDLMDGGNAGGAHAGGTLEEQPGAHTGFSARFDSRHVPVYQKWPQNGPCQHQ